MGPTGSGGTKLMRRRRGWGETWLGHVPTQGRPKIAGGDSEIHHDAVNEGAGQRLGGNGQRWQDVCSPIKNAASRPAGHHVF